MAWSTDFKRRRFEELNKMRIKDRGNYTMCSEYQYILNGIADPTKTHNFSNNYKLTEKEAGHRRRYARKHGFYQHKMANLKTKKMVTRSGYNKTHEAYKNFPSIRDAGSAYDLGDDSWKYNKKPVADATKDLQKVAVKINVNKPANFTEKFTKMFASQFSYAG